jgi:NAD(P)-dependent dehydrogenase (short-subunit alcohol dehydrogenase family)
MGRAEGAKVVCVDINEPATTETAELVSAAGGQAIAVKADVSSDADSKAMVDAAEEAFGGIHVMFNNAGIMHSDDGDSQSTSEATWDLTMDINAKGVFLGCKYGIPAIQKSGGGSIINTASFVARLGAATPQVAYTASKGAVLALTRELAVVHARQGIRINALCPGPLRTELTRRRRSSAGSCMCRWVVSAWPRSWRSRHCSWRPMTPHTSPARSSWSMEASPPPT